MATFAYLRVSTAGQAESSVRIPARERSTVDWATGNRLAEENSDFRKFANLVANFYKAGETSEKEWNKPDSIPPDD